MAPAIGEKTRKLMEQYAKPYRPTPYTPLVPPLKEQSTDDYLVGKFFVRGGDVVRVLHSDDIIDDDYSIRTVYLTSTNGGSLALKIERLSDMIGQTFYTDLRVAWDVAERNRKRIEKTAPLDAARTSGSSP